jgi:hypothetical protein
MGVFFTKPATVSPLAGTTPSLPKRFAIIGVWSQDANTRFSASWLASPRGPVATHYIGSGCKVVHAQPDEDTGSDCRCEPGKGDEFFFRLVQPPPPLKKKHVNAEARVITLICISWSHGAC